MTITLCPVNAAAIEKLPAKDMLAYYASAFGAVEINNTFYRMPAPPLLTGWTEQTPASFRFARVYPVRVVRRSTTVASSFSARASSVGNTCPIADETTNSRPAVSPVTTMIASRESRSVLANTELPRSAAGPVPPKTLAPTGVPFDRLRPEELPKKATRCDRSTP